MLSNGSHQMKRDFKELNIPEPSPKDKLNWLIHIYHVRGERQSCKKLIDSEITNGRTKNEFAYFKNGIILREEGKLQEALEGFQICHKLNPKNVDNFKEIGKCLFQLKRYRLSLEAFLEAESLCTKADWEIYQNIGENYLHLEEREGAKEYIRKAVEVGKQEISFALLIKILVAEGDFRSAILKCNAAVESCPDSVKMLTESGLLYLKVGETQHAFERLSSALALDSTNPKALLGIGCITQNHEEYDVALSKYKLAVQTDGNCVALWNNIGMCFYSKQKFVAAITCLKRALWLSPLNWRVLLNLGLVNLSTGQAASAFNFLCAAVNIRPDLSLPFMILGCTLLLLNDEENAVRALSQALLISAEDPLIIINSCLCFTLTGHHDAATQLLLNLKDLPLTIKNNEMQVLCSQLEEILGEKARYVKNAVQSPDHRIGESENHIRDEFIGDEDEV